MVKSFTAIFLLACCFVVCKSYAQKPSLVTNKTSNYSTETHSNLHEIGNNSLKTIRFYRSNKHDQRIRLNIKKINTDSTGCHNFKRSRRVATVVQINFNSCSVFTEKNCQPESILRANHKDQDAFAEKLTQGHAWQLKRDHTKSNKGIKIRSWSCQ